MDRASRRLADRLIDVHRLAWIATLASCAPGSPTIRNEVPAVRYHVDATDVTSDDDRDCDLQGAERHDIGMLIADHLRDELRHEKITAITIRRGAVDLVGTCTDVDHLETNRVRKGETVIAIDPRTNVGAFVIATRRFRSHYCARVQNDRIVLSKRWVEICAA